MSVIQVWKRKTSTLKSPPPSQNDSPPLSPRVYLQSPSPPSYNPLIDQMINQLHNIFTIMDLHNNLSNAYIHAPPSPPPPEIHPPYHAQVELHSSFCHCIPTAIIEFPLPVHLPTASEDRFPLLSERDAPSEEVCIADEVKNEHYALWEVIEFGDSYEAPQEVADTGSASKGSAKNKGRTVAVTTKDIQKKRNDVKARTTLLLALPDEHQSRFSKYKTAQKLWAAILKTFGGNEATKKTKKNQLKQQYDNFKAEGNETLEQTFNRLRAIVTSLDDLYNHLKVYEPKVQKKSGLNFHNMAFISSAKNISGKEEVNTTSFSTTSTQVSPASVDVATASFSHDTICAYISNGSQFKYEDINHIDEDDLEEMDIKWNMALLSMRADRFWKKTGKRSPYKVLMAPRSQDRGRRENFQQGFKTEEQTPKALMSIDGVGWDWSYMANEEENHALVADEEAPTEFALMAKSSSKNEVFDNSLCSKACKKNIDSLNTKITELSEKLSNTKTTLFHYKLGLSQVESRLVEFKNQEIKFCEKIRGLEFKVESKDNRIERLTKELEELKKEKEGLDRKLTVLFPPPAHVYSPPKKDMSWIGLLKFADDTITDYSRPSPSIKSNSSDLQNSDSFVSEKGDSSKSIMSKPMIKFVKATDSPTEVKISKVETVRKPSVKYAEMYRNTTKSPKFDHLAYDCAVWEEQRKTWPKNNNTHKSMSPRNVFHKTGRTPMRTNRPNMNAAKPKRTSFTKPEHSYVRRPFQRTSVGNSQNIIDDKGYWDSGCSRHMTGNISYLTDYEPYDGGVLFTDSECIVLGRDFKLRDDTNVLLRTPRQHNMYSIDLNNIVLRKDLTCLVAKATDDKSVLWHRRLGHLNFKTMNKLVRHNLVRGLPSKCFENDHTCVACLKGKQYKASCKTKLVHSVTKPLHTLHMDLFRPTSISSLNHKCYCLVVTDDFSRFTWTFFLKTKDETSGILRNFITEIENLKELKNGLAKRRNRTLIKAAKTMLAAKLPVTFWAEAVNTACYVQNRVLINKSQNKTSYELFNGRTPATGFLKPFGCHVMILNTLENLGKFDAKGDEGYFIGYSMSSKAFRWKLQSHWLPQNISPADHIETLTVETLILTVSSPVLTVCLDDSPQPSSDTRLISK
nr:hypothetical protein [Tanacetum cinerariifolium]